ncbi:MAG: hypothetical protein LBQ49_01635, partial [Rickettsiales bacterium]|nr:hypothetical protein [Rickettsiales bacterium]
MNYPTMLSSYSPEDHGALEALKVPGLHRWNGAVALYQTGLPSQDAMLVDGRKSDAVLHGEITEFFRRMHSQGMNVMGIRLDKVGAPHLPPSHAGLPEDARAVVEILRKDIAAGFVPALNVWSDYRYNFRGAMAVTFTDAESLVIDFVGPGYCGAGLSKGMITPPVEISTKSYAPPLSELVKEHRAFMHFYMDIKDEAKILSASDLA